MFFLLEGALQKLLHKVKSPIFWILNPKFLMLFSSIQVDCFQLEKYFSVGVSIADFKNIIHVKTILSTYQNLPVFSLQK